MGIRRNCLPAILMNIIMTLTVTACSLPVSPIEPAPGEDRRRVVLLTPAQEYAGEIMSYLLRVVLGQAGKPDGRREWATQGRRSDLRLQSVYEIMSSPDRNIQEIMVLDSNILDLSRILYHYDQKLSYSKGKPGITSIYPAPEFLAIRMLLLRKIEKGEKISLQSLFEREGKLLKKEYQPSLEDLDATNLRIEEWYLIRDILWKEPHLYRYLKSPFLVKALYETGAAAKDGFTGRKIAEASYRGSRCRLLAGPDGEGSLKILFLPSMTKDFEPSATSDALRPTPFLSDMIGRLQNELIGCMMKQLGETPRISFYVFDELPVVAYPGNAQEVIRDLCPDADFTIIVLGKNVYLALYIDETRDVAPAANRLYIDLADIQYNQAHEACEKVSEFIRRSIHRGGFHKTVTGERQ
jgi:hypothetical protein